MMKKLFLVMALSLSVSMTWAQGNERVRVEDPKERTEAMVSEYGLNEEQAKKLAELNEKYKDVLAPPRGPRPQQPGNGEMRRQRPPRQDGGVEGARPERIQGDNPMMGRMREMMEKRREQMEAYDKELKEIMTEDQFKAYQKKREEMRARRPNFGRPPVQNQ